MERGEVGGESGTGRGQTKSGTVKGRCSEGPAAGDKGGLVIFSLLRESCRGGERCWDWISPVNGSEF